MHRVYPTQAQEAFTAAHESVLAAAQKTDGDAADSRALIEALLLHRLIRTADVVAGAGLEAAA